MGTKNGRVTSAATGRGTINTRQVLISAGAYSAALIYGMLGIKLPISVLTIQAIDKGFDIPELIKRLALTGRKSHDL